MTRRFLQPVRMTEMASCELLAISAGAVSAPTCSLPRAPSATSSPSLKLNEEPWAPSRRRCCCVAALATLPPRPAPDPAFPTGIPQKNSRSSGNVGLHSFSCFWTTEEGITEGNSRVREVQVGPGSEYLHDPTWRLRWCVRRFHIRAPQSLSFLF